MNKINSPSCERNQQSILEVLQKLIGDENQTLLEIGSGTGQHASFMAPQFSKLSWFTSDRVQNHEAIKSWTTGIKEIKGPLRYEIGKDKFPKGKFNYCFSANTFHIMSWKLVKTLVKNLGLELSDGAQVIIYGPFNYDGKYTSESNEKFDSWLKDRDPQSGIRNFEDVKSVMTKNGLQFSQDLEMPANNRILIFTKLSLV